MNTLEQAWALIANGYEVFPVDSVTKRPKTVNGFHDATTHGETVIAWFDKTDYDVAVPTGELVILDVDIKADKDGRVSLSNASVDHGETFTYPTPSGGFHEAYRAAGEVLSSTVNYNGMLGIDRRGYGGYIRVPSGVVLPPVATLKVVPTWFTESKDTETATFDGGTQQWMDTVGAGVPDGLMRSLVGKGSLVGHNVMLSVQAHVIKVAGEGHPGGAATLSALRDRWVSSDHASGDAAEEWDTALRDGIAKFGAPTVGDPLVDDVTPTTDDTATPVWKSVSTLMDMKFRELDWVIPGLICEGTSMIAAPPKAGKSLFMLDIAVAAAGGTEALGGLPTGTPRPTLYIDLESGERRMQARLRALGKVIPSESFFYHLNSETAIETFHKFMAAYKGKRPLVIVDTWVAVSKVKGRDEQQYAFDHKSMAQFQQVTAGDPGSAVILVHHTNKGMATDPMNAINGTNGVAGGIDSPMVLTRERLSDEATLTCMPRDWEGGEFLFNFSGRWSVAGGSLDDAQNAAHKAKADERKTHFGPGKQSVLDIMESSEESMTIGQVVERYVGSGGKTAVTRYLSELSGASLIQRITTGVYKKL